MSQKIETLSNLDAEGRAKIQRGDVFFSPMYGYDVRFIRWEDAYYCAVAPIDGARELPDYVHREQMQKWTPTEPAAMPKPSRAVQPPSQSQQIEMD